ncbi:formyl transferase, partial [Campylobacter jejuni]|nr:formyl transferase [Campylobacter jejuni]
LDTQHKLAIASFKEALKNLEIRSLNSNFRGGVSQKLALPNEGYLDLTWDKEKISRFLRAMDCGTLSGVPK